MSNNRRDYCEGPWVADTRQRGAPISINWRPSPTTTRNLNNLGVHSHNLNTLRAEFINTMHYRDERNRNWETLFEQFVTDQLGLNQTVQTRNDSPAYRTDHHEHSRERKLPNNRAVPMTDDWRPSDEMVELIIATICQNADYIGAQLTSFTSHFHGQQHPNWDQKFKQWINNGWNVYGHKRNYDNESRKDDRGFVEKHSDMSWTDGL